FGGHLAEQVRSAEGEAEDLFHFALKGNHAESRVHASAMNHVLNGANVCWSKAFFTQQPGGEIGAALDVSDGVFSPGALLVLSLFEVAGVMEQDCQDAEPKVPFGHTGLGPGEVAGPQQPAHAQGALQGVFEIVIPRIDGLVIAVTSDETFNGPTERPGNE